MSPLSWPDPAAYDHDDLAETGRLTDEEFGVIDFPAAFGICVERPTERERAYHRARHHLANRGDRPVAAGRRPTTHAHGGAHE